MIVLQLLGWVVASCILMSFVEHQVHARLMHRRSIAAFKKTFEAHAITHHGHYSKIFVDEPVLPGEDKEIRLTVRKAPLKALPVAIVIAFFSIPGALILMAVVTFHHWVWNKIHLQMHKPEPRIFANWPIYKFLAHYHCLHHRYPEKNLNVVFPFADYVLGTAVYRTTEADRIYLKQLELEVQPAAVRQPVSVAQEAPKTRVPAGRV
jgi:hypothetical protein